MVILLYRITFTFSLALGAAFTPRIIIPGVPTAGDNFSILCRLDGVVERLAVTLVSLSLAFINPAGGTAGEMSQNRSAYIRPHFLNPGMTDDVGTYTCLATVIASTSNSTDIFSNASEVLQILSKLFKLE